MIAGRKIYKMTGRYTVADRQFCKMAGRYMIVGRKIYKMTGRYTQAGRKICKVSRILRINNVCLFRQLWANQMSQREREADTEKPEQCPSLFYKSNEIALQLILTYKRVVSEVCRLLS